MEWSWWNDTPPPGAYISNINKEHLIDHDGAILESILPTTTMEADISLVSSVLAFAYLFGTWIAFRIFLVCRDPLFSALQDSHLRSCRILDEWVAASNPLSSNA